MSLQTTLSIKAIANKWMSDNLNGKRKYVMTFRPEYDKTCDVWIVKLATKTEKTVIGDLNIRGTEVKRHTSINVIVKRVEALERRVREDQMSDGRFSRNHKLEFGDGVEGGGRRLKPKSADLLLTDPPYGISSPYTCEEQIPRRLRKSGADFIMPKGEFGEWDHGFEPEVWTEAILPKVGGWAVIFCAHIQIGTYTDILGTHGFNAIGTLVWHKTNPVPFNHKYKPLNAWEAAVVGKRPGTKFNGRSVHNVFTYKSPSPQHRIHPTQKPLGLMEELIDLFTDRNDLVFDPFAGSATTLLAAMNKKRKCLSYENNRKYYDLAVERIRATLSG